MSVIATLSLLPLLQAQAPRSATPPVPTVEGPLQVRVVYPLQGQRISATDSTFLFGSTGNGRAALTVNGHGVEVAPNGAFLAWVPVPPDSAPLFRFAARLAAESSIVELRVLRPRAAGRPDSLWLDASTFSLSGLIWAEPDEVLTMSVTAAGGARVFYEVPGYHPIELIPEGPGPSAPGPFNRDAPGPPRNEARYTRAVRADQLTQLYVDAPGQEAADCCADSASWPRLRIQRDTLGTSARLRPPRVRLIAPDRRPVVMLDDDTARAGNTDGTVTGMPAPSGTFHWFFENGTPAAVSGRNGQFLRLRLSNHSSAWVNVADVAATLSPGTPEPRARLRLVRLAAFDDFVTARIALSARIPYRVDEDGDRLMVRFYGASADADWLQYGSTEPFVRQMSFEQTLSDEVTLTFVLPRPVFGWRARWDGADLLLDIRRPPRIRAARPLSGRVIAVDPGHPPAGATGPTGLREAEANLAVARELRAMLERAGATVIMTRDADTSVGLYERVNLAERMNAELLVSIHNNAFPDGVNPWINNGTSTYYFHPRSVGLARHVQAGMLRTMRLRDTGFGRGDLALVRPTWMPSVLTEGAFMMIPEQENGLRTPAFQRAYARGVYDGIVAYLRELAR